MKLPVRLWDEARLEFDAAVDWYEQQRPGSGARFATAVRIQLERIAGTPMMHAKVHGDVRGSNVPGFPYRIYYLVEPHEVVVISVFHTSRDPAIWQGRSDRT